MCQSNEADTEYGVRSRSEHPYRHLFHDFLALIHSYLKIDLCPVASPDPAPLELFHMIIPLGQVVKVVKHLIGVFPDVKKPLIQQFFLNFSARTPRTAIGIDLLIS